MDFMSWLILIVVLGLVIGVGQQYEKRLRSKGMKSAISAIPDFHATQYVIGCDGITGIAFDESSQKICLLWNIRSQSSQQLKKAIGAGHKDEVKEILAQSQRSLEGRGMTGILKAEGDTAHRSISHKDIMSVELFQDGESVTQTSRSSQVGGALVGGLLLGGLGVVVGGLSGKTRTSQKVSTIDLRIVINDTTSPLHDIGFLNTESSKNGIVYNNALQAARHWLGIMDILIKKADEEQKNAQIAANPTPTATQPVSIADELQKLVNLKTSGVLTEEEFHTQKTKLLSPVM